MNTLTAFVSRWLGTALPQLFLLFLGILLVILVVTTLWERKINPILSRPARGTTLAASLIILIAAVSVFWVGMSAPQVMIGDEVTHYYMLENQAKLLPHANFIAKIPTGWGEIEKRVYPHSFLWHYLGAIFFRLCGNSFAAVQVYQTLYLIQFLSIAYLLARSRGGVETRAAMPYLLVLASLPMTLIFSVAFYQDVPMTAQVLTAFYLLRKNRWLSATLFMAFALGVKVSAILFFPAFFLCLFFWTLQRNSFFKIAAICFSSFILIALCTWGLGTAIEAKTGSTFYPVEKFHQIVHIAERKIWPEQGRAGQGAKTVQKKSTTAALRSPEKKLRAISKHKAAIIANHPGDLRIRANYFIYGGILLWLLLLLGVIAVILQWLGLRSRYFEQKSSTWLFGVGLSYTLMAAAFLASAPDARFFLPGLPFLLLPFAEQTICLPRSKWLISLIASLAILQGGYVLAKTYNLRQVSPKLQKAIAWLRKNPPNPAKIFMYPEGNYRLFPVPHEWYLNYHLRDFWRADNDLRLAMLRRFGIGAVVIKKQLIAPVDANITDLGVYPNYFVRDIRQDKRFRKVFENSGVLIVELPSEEGKQD